MLLKNKKGLDSLFLSTKNQYSKKRQLKVKSVIITVSSLLLLTLILGSFFEKPQKEVEEKTPSYLKNLPTKTSSEISYKELEYDDIKVEEVPQGTRTAKTKSFNREALIGSKHAVRLLGKVIAKSHKSVPVRAKVISFKTNQDEYELDFELKEGSVLLGKGHLDPLSERLHITFHSLLMKGKKYSIQAKAFMKDGTFGVSGKFNSGEFKKYGARFGANFVGGVSQGLKEKTISKSGAIFDSGGLKNAVLNGLSLSFLDYAQDKARKHETPSAKITLKDRTLFFIYFEQ